MKKYNTNPALGQHYLVDNIVLKKFLSAVPKYQNVIEIGAGPGLITKQLLSISKRVIAIELDERYKPELNTLKKSHSNLEVIYKNVLDLLTQDKINNILPTNNNIWIAGNIPYHITEPLMMKLMNLPIKGVTLITGAKFANEITAKLTSENYGKLSMLAQAFFNIEIVDFVGKESFNPKPKTISAIVVLKPKTKEEILSFPNIFLARKLMLSANRGTLIKNVLREAIIEYNQIQSSRKAELDKKPIITKNEAREIINSLKLEDYLLNRSVEQLNNNQLITLCQKIAEYFG